LLYKKFGLDDIYIIALYPSNAGITRYNICNLNHLFLLLLLRVGFFPQHPPSLAACGVGFLWAQLPDLSGQQRSRRAVADVAPRFQLHRRKWTQMAVLLALWMDGFGSFNTHMEFQGIYRKGVASFSKKKLPR
jgi:hypothetical protein